MNFANVTDISIPEGNVIKIHETNSGRVLWQKMNVFDNKYPKLIIELKTVTGEKYYRAYYKHIATNGKQYIENTELPNIFPAFTTLAANDLTVLQFEKLKVSVGDEFTAYYANNAVELINFPNNAHLVNDAVWKSSYFWVDGNTDSTTIGYCAINNNSNIDEYIGCRFHVPGAKAAPIQYSTNIGSRVTITAIYDVKDVDTDVMGFPTAIEEADDAYENPSGKDYKPKSLYPYIGAEYDLTVSSPSIFTGLLTSSSFLPIRFFWLYSR